LEILQLAHDRLKRMAQSGAKLMVCRFEQVGKEIRIEIPSAITRFTSLAFAIHLYGGWCLCSFGAAVLWNSQGAEVDVLPSIIGAVSGFIISVIGWTKEDSGRGLRSYIGYFAFCGANIAIGSFFCFVFWRPEGAFLLSFLMVILLIAIVGMNIAMVGYRDDVLVGDGAIKIARTWLNLRFENHFFERRHCDVDFELQSPLSSKSPKVPELFSVLLFDNNRSIRLGLFQSEEDLRRIHAILSPKDVINCGEGIWEFSDPHLRQVSKGEVSLQ
jgi:hypothetical protein